MEATITTVITILKTATITTEVEGVEMTDMVNITKTVEVEEDIIEVAVDGTGADVTIDLMEINRIITIIWTKTIMVAVLREVEMTKTEVMEMVAGIGIETTEGTSETMVEEEVLTEEGVDIKEVAVADRGVDSNEAITAEAVAIATIVTS